MTICGGTSYGPSSPRLPLRWLSTGYARGTLATSAKTTHAVRVELQRSKASAAALAERFGINAKTVLKWRKRASVEDSRMGPKEARSTVLTPLEEAAIIAFRQKTLLPLDDVLFTLQPQISHLTRSNLHRLLERHGISRLPKDESTRRPIGGPGRSPRARPERGDVRLLRRRSAELDPRCPYHGYMTKIQKVAKQHDPDRMTGSYLQDTPQKLPLCRLCLGRPSETSRYDGNPPSRR